MTKISEKAFFQYLKTGILPDRFACEEDLHEHIKMHFTEEERRHIRERCYDELEPKERWKWGFQDPNMMKSLEILDFICNIPIIKPEWSNITIFYPPHFQLKIYPLAIKKIANLLIS